MRNEPVGADASFPLYLLVLCRGLFLDDLASSLASGVFFQLSALSFRVSSYLPTSHSTRATSPPSATFTLSPVLYPRPDNPEEGQKGRSKVSNYVIPASAKAATDKHLQSRRSRSTCVMTMAVGTGWNWGCEAHDGEAHVATE